MKKCDKMVDFSIFSDSRKILMSIATIMIVLVHSSQNLDFIFGSHEIFKDAWMATDDLFYGGVDIFLFVSGFGLYYSLRKNNNIISFYKRRFIRIVPELLCVSLVWSLGTQILDGNFSFLNLLKDITMVNFFIDGNRNYWFFSFILVLYIIYPLIDYIIQKFNHYGFYTLLLLTIILTIIANYKMKSYYLYEIAITRIPSFLFGVYFAKLSISKHKVNFINVPLSIFIIISIWLIAYYNWINIPSLLFLRYLTTIFAISVAFLISYISTKYKLNQKLSLTWIGGYSMEIYLIYEKIIACYKKFGFINEQTGFLLTFISFTTTIVIVILFKKVINTVLNKIIKNN